MSYSQDQIPGVHPAISFIITFICLLFSRFMPELFILMHYHIPPLFIEAFQSFAYCGTGIIGIIAALNYFGIKWNPFKKRKKNGK